MTITFAADLIFLTKLTAGWQAPRGKQDDPQRINLPLTIADPHDPVDIQYPGFK
jgi:hypothetical protein